MVVGWVLSGKTVEHTTEHSNDQRENERKDTVLRLVDASVALGTPFDKSV